MPYDGTDYLPRPAHPDAAYLSRVLREGPDGPLWPTGFVWNYMHCASCALGLAHQFWPEINDNTSLDDDGAAFGLSPSDAYDVFVDQAYLRDLKSMQQVAPAMVADALDAAFAQQVPA